MTAEKIKKRVMICVTCPIGCEMTIEYAEKKIISLSGNTCKRGEKYAADEIKNPRRTITSTIPIENENMNIKFLPVKTDKPIPKEKIFDAMKIINNQKVKIPVKTGDVIVADFIESGVNLVACRSVK